MRVDPVFVLSPLPKPPSMPTRRAFLLASGALAVGAAVGGACGYSSGFAAGSASAGSGASPGGGGVAPAGEPELPKSGDVELDELRRLAVKAPLDELFARAPLLLSSRVSTYPDDVILWRGVDRLSKEIIDNPSRRVVPGVIGIIITQIEGTARPADPALTDRVARLHARRAEELRRK